MKKIIVFGATGGAGKLVVGQALEAGYLVTVIARNPDAFTISNKNLEIIKGDVLQPATFADAVKGKDVVVSCLGSKNLGPTTLYSEGAGNIVAAMKKVGVNRIICISADAVIIPPKISPLMKFFLKNVLQRVFKHMYADMLLMENMLSRSGLNWTVIRAPNLKNGKRTQKYRVTVNEDMDNPASISRADLADYIVKHLTDEKTYKTKVEISY